MAVAVVRLMDGQLTDWRSFDAAQHPHLGDLPRKRLKSGYEDVKRRLNPDIRDFCKANFEDMDQEKLCRIYEYIRQWRGLNMSLADFERQYGCILSPARRFCPPHATVHISLWGLQFEYPEDYLSKDLREALELARAAERELNAYRDATQSEATDQREEVACLVRRRDYASRTSLICCFNLVEAYLNGIAWHFVQEGRDQGLSASKRKLVRGENATLRDKLLKYPAILGEGELWDETHEVVAEFLDDLKPLRDSLTHASPFSAPERFGGYDKLRNLYAIGVGHAERAARCAVGIVDRIHRHLNGNDAQQPRWLDDLRRQLDQSGRRQEDASAT